MPHLADLMVDDPHELLAGSDTIVVGNGNPEFAELVTGASDRLVVDLVGLGLSEEQRMVLGDRYQGISW